ncbi:MAG: hypothetical protein PHT97_11965, partial [Methanoculleus sp.]|uniref:hypothetical protein n=1 Tax=Methanoculleus sp. TaxID=90427 RepID=UPI00262DA267
YKITIIFAQSITMPLKYRYCTIFFSNFMGGGDPLPVSPSPRCDIPSKSVLSAIKGNLLEYGLKIETVGGSMTIRRRDAGED